MEAEAKWTFSSQEYLGSSMGLARSGPAVTRSCAPPNPTVLNPPAAEPHREKTAARTPRRGRRGGPGLQEKLPAPAIPRCSTRALRLPSSPCASMSVHRRCWLWVFFLIVLFSPLGVYSSEEYEEGSCRYDLSSIASFLCMQPNGVWRPPSPTCCNALLHAFDTIPADRESGACCLCRYMKEKLVPFELVTTYILCEGKDSHVVKRWSSLAIKTCKAECMNRKNSDGFPSAASGLEMGPEIVRFDSRAYYSSITPRPRFGYDPGSVIVIDLGNTNSCVSGYRGETMFRFCIPSWVAFTSDGAALVGEATKNHAHADPEAAIFGFKRLLGLSRYRIYQEDIVQGLIERVPYKIGAAPYDWIDIQVKAKDGMVKHLYVRDIASMVVTELKEKAEEHLGHEVRDTVVTIPQHFPGSSRDEAMDAVGMRYARLHIETAVSEPIAAAVAYGLRTKLREDGNALVLHVGGGTAYASFVTLMDGGLHVFGHWHEEFLGGDDFDQRIMDHFVKLIRTKHGKDIGEDGIALRRLRTACERAKKALSSQDRVQVTVASLFDGLDFSEPLSRSEFEELNDDLFHKVIAMIDKVMLEIETTMQRNKSMIDEVVLVGGSTMIPRIQKLVKVYFDGKEPNIRVKPDEAVTIGAAIIAHSPDWMYNN